HQPHDGASIHPLAIFQDGDFRLEARGGFHDLGAGAGVQAALVDDAGGGGKFFGGVHQPRSADPARMYLRPASMASLTACSSGSLLRMSSSLIRLGRLM